MSGDLAGVHITSGVNESGVGFLTIAAQDEDGGLLIGQMTPTEIRDMALGWLSAAEAAEQDAAVLRVIRKLELPEQLAGAVIADLRNDRANPT